MMKILNKEQINFYDTCSLLEKKDFTNENIFYISSITLEELENIKTSSKKDEEIKFQARHLLHFLEENGKRYKVIQFKEKFLKPFLKKGYSITNDIKILATALSLKNKIINFYTNDLALKQIAKIFISNVYSVKNDNNEEYDGYKEIVLTDEELVDFYTKKQNIFNLLPNEYVIIKNSENKIIDNFCWTGEEFRQVIYKTIPTYHFDEIKPIKGDPYQIIAIDSFNNNKITMIKGPAGSGKTLLSLGYLFNKLEKGKIDKIIIFCNTVATKNSARLGLTY